MKDSKDSAARRRCRHNGRRSPVRVTGPPSQSRSPEPVALSLASATRRPLAGTGSRGSRAQPARLVDGGCGQVFMYGPEKRTSACSRGPAAPQLSDTRLPCRTMNTRSNLNRITLPTVGCPAALGHAPAVAPRPSRHLVPAPTEGAERPQRPSPAAGSPPHKRPSVRTPARPTGPPASLSSHRLRVSHVAHAGDLASIPVPQEPVPARVPVAAPRPMGPLRAPRAQPPRSRCCGTHPHVSYDSTVASDLRPRPPLTSQVRRASGCGQRSGPPN